MYGGKSLTDAHGCVPLRQCLPASLVTEVFVTLRFLSLIVCDVGKFLRLHVSTGECLARSEWRNDVHPVIIDKQPLSPQHSPRDEDWKRLSCILRSTGIGSYTKGVQHNSLPHDTYSACLLKSCNQPNSSVPLLLGQEGWNDFTLSNCFSVSSSTQPATVS